MRKVGAGLYEAEFKAPDSDEYLLWLRLQNREGGVVYSAQSLQLMAVLFTEEHPILVFMGGSYLPSRREAFLSDLGTVLQPLGLEANILKIVPEKGFPYQAFLKHYIEPGKVAIWLGHSLDEEGQAAFGEFLDLGGQLLMSSFSLRTSPGINTFLRECLGISQIGNSERGQFPGASTALVQDFSMLYRPLTLVDPALPSVVDKEGRVAGLRLDEEISRVTFLSFDLFNMEAYTRRELLQTELIFLLAPRLGRVNLQVQAVRAPDRLMPLERIVPEIIVANTGGEPSGPFSVGYQILQGEEVLFSAERDIASLEGGIARVVQLPAWMPVGAEDFQIRFGVGTPDENRLAYSPARPLHVVEGVAPFDELILPGAVSSGNGAGFFDYDNDGDSDLYLVRRNAANQLFRNDGTEFSEQAEEAGIADDGLGRGLALGDYDGDGDLDLYLVNEGANRFLFNDGDGRFSEGIERLSVHPGEQRKLANDASGRSAGFFDYDGDGDLDLYLVNATGVNCLFENTAGQFSEVATTAGLADAGNGRGLAFGDYDGDGDIDLFVANQTGGGHFFRNDRGTFRDVNRHLGLEFAGGEVGAVFGDYDDDGDLDLFLSSETGPSYLNRNEGGFSFERVVGKDSLYLGSQTVGAAFLDYDNDGDLDLATTALRAEAGGDALYQNRGDGMFISVGELLQLRTESSGRGLSFSDYDGDGDLDLFIADSRRSHFYRNTADPTHWLQVELEGPPVNRQGLGASVELVAGGRPQYRELQSAFGYGSQVQPGVHFGLGTAVQADTLRVRWPDGLQTIQFGLRAGQRLLLFHPRLSTAVTEAEGRDLGRFRLFSNVPNPFNAGTIIHFELPRSGEMELAVFNVLGQPVRGLINGVLDAGVYQVAWNGRDEGGRNLGSGVYFCRLAGDGRVQTRRMLLLK